MQPSGTAGFPARMGLLLRKLVELSSRVPRVSLSSSSREGPSSVMWEGLSSPGGRSAYSVCFIAS